ncbi:hypothetical protein, partial [Burkholderia thailandensis]|uniref:hypothetical protein n=1 Tax=Burkholderia thailandensis TaxID=57975 RepID=UPI0021C8B16F
MAASNRVSRNRALATRELRSAWPRFMVTHGFECGSARRLAPGVFFAVRRSPFDIRRTSTARAHRRAQEKTACDIRKPFSMPADRSRARIADSA